MKNIFNDLLSLSEKAPDWFDENGTPRFVKFHPTNCPNIYNDTAFLLLIACQNCAVEFSVEVSYKPFHQFAGEINALHYGDPPAHGCSGDTMNCLDIKVLEAWNRNNKSREWKRYKRYEVEIK